MSYLGNMWKKRPPIQKTTNDFMFMNNMNMKDIEYLSTGRKFEEKLEKKCNCVTLSTRKNSLSLEIMLCISCNYLKLI